MSHLKRELHRKLQASRTGLLSKLEGLGEYDMRRPMTPTATNLLGLVKHLAGLEYGYLGESFQPPGAGDHPLDPGRVDLGGRRHVGHSRRVQ